MAHLRAFCDQEVALPPELEPFLARDVAADAPEDAYRDKAPGLCLRSHSFWLLFFTAAVCSGAGLTLLNNTAQMVRRPGTRMLSSKREPRGTPEHSL